MKQTAKVIGLEGEKALLEITRASACGHCHGDCLSCKGAKRVTISVENTLSAQRGDTVEVMTDSVNILKIAFLVYILPLLAALICGIWVYSSGTNGYYATLFALIAGAVVFFFLRIYSKNIEKQGVEFCEMVSIVERKG